MRNSPSSRRGSSPLTASLGSASPEAVQQGAQRGFTLVELLVVIGIIAVLIGILLPTLARARESANVTACLSNLRQLGIAIDLYSVQNKNVMPLAMERSMLIGAAPAAYGLVGAGRGRTWAGLIRDVAKVPANVFRCPSDQRFELPAPEGFLVSLPGEVNAFTDTKFIFSYTTPWVGYHRDTRRMPWSVSHLPLVHPNQTVRGAMPRSRLKRASEIHLVWDGYVPFLSNGQGYAEPLTTNGLKKNLITNFNGRGSLVKAHVFRHTRIKKIDRGPNALFADGHAEAGINVLDLTDDNFTYAK